MITTMKFRIPENQKTLRQPGQQPTYYASAWTVELISKLVRSLVWTAEKSIFVITSRRCTLLSCISWNEGLITYLFTFSLSLIEAVQNQ
jgi:hypothetical protein